MNKSRKTIEKLKEQLRADVAANAIKYKRAIIKQIDKLYRQSGSGDLETFAKNFLQNFKLTAKEEKLLLGDLETTQKQIADAWNEYFNQSPSANYEKLVAVNSIDLSKTSLEDDVKKTVTTEIKKAISGEYGIQSIITKLKNTGLGSHEAYTLANTALAQFDNSYMAEVASQAGVIYYLIDGILSDNSRIWCKKHFKRVYTLAELAELDNGQGLPVETALGGYHCQHYLTPLVNYIRKVFGEIYNPAHHKLAA